MNELMELKKYVDSLIENVLSDHFKDLTKGTIERLKAPYTPEDKAMVIKNLKIGAAEIAGYTGLGVAGYAAYKLAKHNKWKKNGCANLSEKEKNKCQEYLKNKG